MPVDHEQQERERKQRIRKLKAKTSKMRLAVVSKKTPLVTLGDKKFYNMTEFEDHMASTDRPTYSGEIPGAADKLRKQRAKTKKAAVKKKTKDQDEENEHNRDNYNAQSSVETGGDS